MNKAKSIFILVNLVALIGYFNWSIYAKEKTLKEGKLVLLELAPVDPRSLMQGDYMRLNYSVNHLPEDPKIDKRGFCILELDSNQVGTRIAFKSKIENLKANQVAVKYFFDGSPYFASIHTGADSYFFQEGQGKKYELAKYGALKIDDAGNSILIGLYDGDLKLIQ